ncbi:MAG: leucine-rich repeat domain-containing protein [Verrucomicrobiota bacterium]|jgi:hypothetical protein
MKSKNVLCGLAIAVVLQLGMLAGSAQDAYSTNADGSIYTYSTNADGSANIVAYAGPPWVVTIPTNINGLTATTIGLDAFNDLTNLTSVTIPSSVTSIGDGAFWYCTGLTNITIPGSVTFIGSDAFLYCFSLTSVYFTGNAPSPTNDYTVFAADSATVYYLPGTTGWGAMFDGLPTALWLPQVQTSNGSFGVQSNQFGFNINWAANMVVVVEAATNLANPVWIAVSINTLTGGTSYFSDPQWTNFPQRFYRVQLSP